MGGERQGQGQGQRQERQGQAPGTSQTQRQEKEEKTPSVEFRLNARSCYAEWLPDVVELLDQHPYISVPELLRRISACCVNSFDVHFVLSLLARTTSNALGIHHHALKDVPLVPVSGKGPSSRTDSLPIAPQLAKEHFYRMASNLDASSSALVCETALGLVTALN